MSKEYNENQEVEQIAKELIPQMGWEHLPDIKFLMLVTEKNQYLGKCSKATGKWRYLVDKDYVIEVWEDYWSTATSEQKRALLYHELKHIDYGEEKDDGELVWKIRRHDIEEFNDVVSKYKLWRPELQEFQRCLGGKDEKNV